MAWKTKEFKEAGCGILPRETELIKELQEAALDKCVIAALESTNK